MERHLVGIVIPAYNEERTILHVIEKVSRYGVPIVVNDASSDQTEQVAQAASAQVVTHPYNMGYDAALESGFGRADVLGCQLVITVDADGQHPPELLQEYIDRLSNTADVVAGVRDVKQRFAERLFGWLTTLLYGVQDPLCGMKGYRIAVYQRAGHFDSYHSIGTELLLFALRSGFQVEQVAVKTRKRQGRSRFGQVFSGNYKIMRAMVLSFIKIQPAQ
ncbi:MAG: glycosyltransferase family 2 protein [Magnetococcales bacterium]|nr:glycosyltransferase family 2 protein [Magnetococcales bacterium]